MILERNWREGTYAYSRMGIVYWCFNRIDMLIFVDSSEISVMSLKLGMNQVYAFVFMFRNYT